jgi:BirA family biotin operon repressor/biotin-[acetyl-CoA-carboxylase] ligase
MNFVLIHLDCVDSTNSFAKRELQLFADETTTCITADEQSGGRGRFGNQWLSPKGQNLYLTFVEKVRSSLQLVHYSHVASLAMFSVLHSFGIASHVKWPNDLLVQGKKICGILVEGTSKGKTPWAIVGIGLNINMEAELLRSIDRPATSMQEVLTSEVSIQKVQEKTIETILATLQWASENPSLCQQQYLSLCTWMEETHAIVQTATGTIEGTIKGFSPEGHLLLQKPTGETIAIVQGVVL